VLAVASNLYGYGPVDGPITDATPLAATHPKLRLRAGHVAQALSRHQAGPHPRHRDPVQRLHRSQFDPQLRSAQADPGGQARLRPRELDVPHSWTAISDAVRTSSPSPRGARVGQGVAGAQQSAVDGARARHPVRFSVRRARPKLSPIPYPVLWAAGLFVPLVRELRATRYQFVLPFVVDASLTETTSGSPRPISPLRSRPCRRREKRLPIARW
jgi:hypothetical protein